MTRALKLQRGLCFYCGVEIGMNGHLDHLVPVYYGGKNQKRNLVATCRHCNLTKSTDHLEITNVYTINKYLNLQKHYKKLLTKNRRYMHMSKKYRLYKLYRAELFKSI